MLDALRPAFFLSCVLASMSAGCSSTASKATPGGADAGDGGKQRNDAGTRSGADVVQFDETSCPMTIPTGLSASNITCGMLTVPEEHANPNGPTIQLAVAIVKATGPSPAPDPVLFFGGGPGAAVLEGYINTFQQSEALPELLKNRDWVFFDQRGVGYSKPALDCPERADAYWSALAQPLTPTEHNDQVAAGMKACHDRLVASGVNLNAYRTSESAQDSHDLMRALGYNEWNLYGISYGTKLAQVAMREAPDGIRSVVLDSSEPVGYDFSDSLASVTQRVFMELFDGCAADSACGQAFPSLDQTFYSLVTSLNTSPATIQPTDSVTGQPFTIALTGDRLAYGIQQAAYATNVIPQLPKVIANAAAGDYTLIVLGQASAKQGKPASWGQYFSIQCAEDVPFASSALRAQFEQGVHPELLPLDVLGGDYLTAVCQFWSVDAVDASFLQAVSSDIPTLVLAGQYDPILPPALDQEIAASLSNSQYFEFPGVGHGVVRAATAETDRPRCAVRLTQQFLDAPTATLDGSCVSALLPPKFVAP